MQRAHHSRNSQERGAEPARFYLVERKKRAGLGYLAQPHERHGPEIACLALAPHIQPLSLEKDKRRRSYCFWLMARNPLKIRVCSTRSIPLMCSGGRCSSRKSDSARASAAAIS